MASHRLAFDIGSKNVKCGIGDENDDIIAMESFRPAVACSDDGFSRCCDASTYWTDLLALARKTIAKALIAAEDIKFVTCSSIRPSCVFVDNRDNLIYIGSSFDLRGINSADTIENEFEKAAGKSFFKTTGHFPLLMYPPARYAWFKENDPGNCKRIAKYLPVDSWVLGKFGAEEHANIASAAESGFYDIGKRDWNYEWTDILGLPSDFFPPVIQSGEITGDASKETRDVLGLPRDAVVVSGLPDTQAALIGAGCIEEMDAAIVVGSTTPVQLLKKDLTFDPAARVWTTMLNLKNVVDTHVLEASTGITGQLVSWLAALFFSNDGHFKNEYLARVDAEYDLHDAEELGKAGEIRDVLAFLGPDFLASSSSTILPGAFIFPTPGTVDEITLSRRHFISATFENIQFAARKNLSFLQDITGRMTGKTYLLGGVTRSATFCQRFADLATTAIYSTVEKEATMSGLFHACSVAAGDITSAARLKNKIELQARVGLKTPRQEMIALMQDKYSKWTALKDKIREL